jgi:hypothetical protein
MKRAWIRTAVLAAINRIGNSGPPRPQTVDFVAPPGVRDCGAPRRATQRDITINIRRSSRLTGSMSD